MSALIVVMSVGLGGLVVGGIAWFGEDRRLVATSVVGLAAWFAAALALAALDVFKSTPDRSVPVIAFGIALPTIAGGLLLARASAVRGAVRRVPLPALVGVQAFRVFGFVFLIAFAQDRMPLVFALPAGIGDIAVGLAAPLVAFYLARRGGRGGRTAALLWSLAGLADLVLAVTLGFLSAPSPFQHLALSHPNAAITTFPYVLVPVFAVPIAVVLHVAVLWRLRTDDDGILASQGRLVAAFG